MNILSYLLVFVKSTPYGFKSYLNDIMMWHVALYKL